MPHQPRLSVITRLRYLSGAMTATRIRDAGATGTGLVLGGIVAPDQYGVLGALAGASLAALGRLLYGGGGWKREAESWISEFEAEAEAASVPFDNWFESGILSEIPVPFMILDAAMIVRFCSNDVRRALFIDPVGRRISMVFRSPTLLDAVERAITHDEAARFEFTSRRARGTIFLAELRPLKAAAPGGGNGDGKPRVMLVLLDITRQRQAEEMRIDFVANASHELRTPLAAISGLVETLRGPARNDERNRDRFLGIIAEQTERMIRLVNDLLSLSRIEMEENVVPTAEVDIRAIVVEATSALSALAEKTGNSIEIDLPEALPPVIGIRDEIMQVFINLIGNAIKYGGPDRPVLIHVAAPVEDAPRETVGITVEDFGPGIDASQVPRLTERFFRVNKEDSLKRGGTGLGLAIVKHIMHHHRGSLDIDSAPGKGSQFTVRFPLSTLSKTIND